MNRDELLVEKHILETCDQTVIDFFGLFAALIMCLYVLTGELRYFYLIFAILIFCICALDVIRREML